MPSLTTPWLEVVEPDPRVVSLTAAYPDHDGDIGTGGSMRLRSRRVEGAAQWAFELIFGTSPSLPTGPLILQAFDDLVSTPANAGITAVAGGISVPTLATYTRAADGDRAMGTAEFVETTYIPTGGVGAQVLDLYLVLWWTDGRWSAAVPFAPAAGDRIVAGNVLEALDN